MSSKPWYGSTLAEIESHMFTFQQATDYWGATVSFTAAQISRVDNAQNNLASAKDNLALAKQSMVEAQREFDDAVKAAIGTMRDLSKKVRVSPNATAGILNAFGMPVYSPPSKSAPKTPTGLTAQPSSGGAIKLKWSAAGNIAGTLYEIQIKRGNGNWRNLEQLKATKFSDSSLAPGSPALYRVRAIRRGVTSEWSNLAAVYMSLAA